MNEFDPTLVEQAARVLWQNNPGYSDSPDAFVTDALAVLTAVAPTIYEEIMTDTFHPEFGFAWREPDGECYKAYQQGRAEGARQVAAAANEAAAKAGVQVVIAAREAVARIEGGA